jgi:hypothetical protein
MVHIQDFNKPEITWPIAVESSMITCLDGILQTVHVMGYAWSLW